MAISRLLLVVAVAALGCSTPGDGEPPAGGSGAGGGGAGNTGGAAAGSEGAGDTASVGGEGAGAEGGTGASTNGGTAATANGGTGATANGGSSAGSEDGGAGAGNETECTGALRLPSVPWPKVGSKPYAVAAADVDGDGVVDLVSVDHEFGELTILRGKGDGTYGVTQTIDALYEQLRAIDAADLDGDGRAELLVMSEYYKRLYVYPNDGTGVFLKPTTYQLEVLYPPQLDGATRVRAADFNGDGHSDVAVVSGGLVKVLLGLGDGTLGAVVEYWAGPTPASGEALSSADNLVVADVNGDEVLDLITANTGNAKVGILPGKGNGTFEDAYEIHGYTSPRAVAVADFDGDDKVDLAIANWNGQVSLVRGNGLGGFELAGLLTTEISPTDIVSGDFNADGKNDLAVSDDIGTLRFFLGNGDGSFQADVTYQGYAERYPEGLPQPLLTTDLNEDGVADVVMANSGASSLGIFLGRTQAAPQGLRLLPVGSPAGVRFGTAGLTHVDFNLDGRMDLVGSAFYTDEVSVLLAAPGGGFEPSVEYPVGDSPGEVLAADFNNDGNPDIAYSVGSVGILLGDGQGGVLEQDAGAAPPDYVFDFAAADVNGDHNVDLITAGNQSYVLLGKGNGLFAEAIQGPVMGFDLATADFDHDGKVDVAMTGYDNDVVVAFGKGDGTFEPLSFDVGEKSRGVVAADFDGDGNPDLATSTSHEIRYGRDTVDHVSVLLGTGTRSFGEPAAYPSTPSAVRRAADMDGDGKLDLILTGATTLGVLLNQGDGSFGPEQDYAAGSNYADGVTAADFNGDGKTDLATTAMYRTTEREGGGVAVLLNKVCGGVASDDAWGSTSTVGNPNQSAGAGWGGTP